MFRKNELNRTVSLYRIWNACLLVAYWKRGSCIHAWLNYNVTNHRWACVNQIVQGCAICGPPDKWHCHTGALELGQKNAFVIVQRPEKNIRYQLFRCGTFYPPSLKKMGLPPVSIIFWKILIQCMTLIIAPFIHFANWSRAHVKSTNSLLLHMARQNKCIIIIIIIIKSMHIFRKKK